jgi:hypothetical protein
MSTEDNNSTETSNTEQVVLVSNNYIAENISASYIKNN